MCMNLNFLMLSGAVVSVPEKRVRPEDQLCITRFYLKQDKDSLPILCKAYGERLADKLNVSESDIKAGKLTWLLCQGRLETIEQTVNGSKRYITELVLSDIFPATPNMGVNIFMTAGRSVKDGDFYIGTGEKKSLCSSRMAVNRGSGDSQKTEFISVKTFDKKAEFVSKYIKKGTPFYAKGRLAISTYPDDHGNQRMSYDLMASDVDFTAEKKAGGESSQSAGAGQGMSQPIANASGFTGGFNSGWGDIPLN